MNLQDIAHATSAVVKSAASQSGAELPAQSRSLQAADFERLMTQAQEQQAQVQLTNPLGEVGQKGVNRMAKDLGDSSQNFRTALGSFQQSIDKFDPSDPASVRSAMHHIDDVMMAGMQLSVMVTEMTAVKKGLNELFHNQG
jgi:cellobiose-specific phosphotransferase system component IIA